MDLKKKQRVKFRPLSEKVWDEMIMDMTDFIKKHETEQEIYGLYRGNFFSILKSSLND